MYCFWIKIHFEKKEFDYVIPMDGDGEDQPEEIRKFIEISQKLEKNLL